MILLKNSVIFLQIWISGFMPYSLKKKITGSQAVSYEGQYKLKKKMKDSKLLNNRASWKISVRLFQKLFLKIFYLLVILRSSKYIMSQSLYLSCMLNS